MGTPIDEIVYGNNCILCEPSLFVPGKTPKIMKVVFHDIVQCPTAHGPPPNNVLFTLDQSPANPCAWSVLIPDPYFVSFQVAPDFSQAFLSHSINFDVFFQTLLQVTCLASPIPNEATCADIQGEGGHMHYWWEPDNIPFTLAVTYALCQMPGGLFDRSPSADGGQCIKLANPIDKTNILVKVSP